MKHFFPRIFKALEDTPLSLLTASTTFLGLIITRLIIEGALGSFEPHSFSYLFFEFSHTFFFFLCSFLLFLPIVQLAGKENLKKSTNVLLFGFLLILTPPIIDKIIFQDQAFWSFYEFDGLIGLVQRYFTLFGDTPSIGITYGVRVEVVLVTLALGFYAFIKQKKLLTALGISLLSYTVLFVLGTFPSWLTLILLAFQKSLLAISAPDVAAIFLSPEAILGRELPDLRAVLNIKMSLFYACFTILLSGALLFHFAKEHFIALLKNARIPQLVYHGGLLTLGMALALTFTDTSLSFSSPFTFLAYILLIAAVECAWLASVVVNDIFDVAIDEKTNSFRPLIQKTIPKDQFMTYGALFFFASLLFAGLVSFQALLLLLAYQAIAWLYSAPPLRLKRFLGIATLLAGCAGILVLCAGFLAVAPETGILTLPSTLLFFLLVGYTLSLPIKDFKDVTGDAADNVYTLPVVVGIQNAKWILGSLFFILYALSPFILHETALFFPALLFGSLSFWTLQKANEKEASFFAFRKLPIPLLMLIGVYGICIFFFLR
ncbi:MAG: UbiA family prenyltransferase [Patescibacteria group bacterium]